MRNNEYDANRIFEYIEEMYRQEEAKKQEAVTERAIADDMKAEAIKKEKAAKAVIKELGAAKLHVEKAQTLNEVKVENEEEVEVIETPVEKETVVVKED